MTEKELRVAFNSYIRDYGEMIGRSTRNMRQTILLHFTQGVNASDKHWKEKTRWKSLETEPPSELRYDKMYLLRTESGSPYLIPSLNKGSIKEFIDCGFIQWKEIE